MKILFVTNEIPFPPDNGVRIVSYNAMRLMHKSGHQLALAVLSNENDFIDERLEKVSELCEKEFVSFTSVKSGARFKSLLSSLLTGRLFFIQRYYSEEFALNIRRIIEKFKPDAIHFDLITMTQYVDIVPDGIRTVASINDSYTLALENSLADGLYKGFVRVYRKLQYYQAREYERSAYQKFDVVHTMSEVDARYLRALSANITTKVIPNGVDRALFDVAPKSRGKTNVIFVAKLAGANLVYLKRFIEMGWKYIHEIHPWVELHIIGELTAESKKIQDEYKNDTSIIFKGYVENLSDAYEQCGISVVPINKNCGLINKAIEAMAAGLVTVGFVNTFSGIGSAHDNVHYVSTNTYSEMGEVIVELLRDESKRKRIQQAAHQLAVEEFSWESRSYAYEVMYGKMSNQNGGKQVADSVSEK